jgi:hypothetical protein
MADGRPLYIVRGRLFSRLAVIDGYLSSAGKESFTLAKTAAGFNLAADWYRNEGQTSKYCESRFDLRGAAPKSPLVFLSSVFGIL